MSNELENTGKILIYQNEKGDTKIDVYFEGDTIWMTQKSMCDLYQVAKSSISEHISNIFKDGELDSASVVKECLTTGADGKNYKTKFYNLDVIISVGYRVKSQRGVQFLNSAHGTDLRQLGGQFVVLQRVGWILVFQLCHQQSQKTAL